MRSLEPGHSRRHAGVTTALVLDPLHADHRGTIRRDRSGPHGLLHLSSTPSDIHIAEAARRFGIPQPWIRAVMEVEECGAIRGRGESRGRHGAYADHARHLGRIACSL